MFATQPKVAHKMADKMKAKSGTKHPIKPLPKKAKGSKSTPLKTRKAWAKEVKGRKISTKK